MDEISLSGIRVNTNIGITQEEIMLEQEIYIDLHLYYDFKKIQESDDLKDGINYAEVISYLREASSELQTHTLESYINSIAMLLKKKFKLESIKLAVETTRFNETLDLDEVKVHITR
ncbi:FolB domain-containing protein [bacterium]|nr:FolB domain-containing protein [bacterium]